MRCPARRFRGPWLPVVVLLVAACGGSEAARPAVPAPDSPEVAGALEAIRGEAIERHVRVLAHDSLEGRAPGTAGFAGAMRYVEAELEALGLQPAGVDGSWRQPVPLRGSVVVEELSSMRIVGAAGATDLAYGVDYYMSPDPLREEVGLEEAPVVFVGYGVSAPSLGYDDYADVDVSGAVVAYLSGAPPSLPSNERAYYSSGATKVAEATRRGAIGVLGFWSPDDPRFRWEVSVATAKRGSFAWLDDEGRPNRGDMRTLGSASLNHSAARALFEGAPKPLEEVFQAAAASTPQAFDLAALVSMTTRTAHRPVDSWNVVARLEGSDPELSAEHVVYVAHADHFGRGEPVNGDDIYNGAHDNASGTAIVLEIARAFAALPEAPRRSILFLIVTAEEWGLLGSDYFASNPTVGRQGIVATFSLDMPFLYHPLKDIVPYGAQHSSLARPVAAAAAQLGMTLAEDPIPEQVLFIRSDHYSFIRKGVPALFIKAGFQTGDPALDGAAINAAYRRDVYHTPSDDVDQAFDWEAGASHARVNFLTGYQVAQESQRPTWNPGDFFGTLFGTARPPLEDRP